MKEVETRVSFLEKTKVMIYKSCHGLLDAEAVLVWRSQVFIH